MRNNSAEETSRTVMPGINKESERGRQAGVFRFKFLLNDPFPVTTDVLMRIGWRGSLN